MLKTSKICTGEQIARAMIHGLDESLGDTRDKLRKITEIAESEDDLDAIEKISMADDYTLINVQKLGMDWQGIAIRPGESIKRTMTQIQRVGKNAHMSTAIQG